MSSALTLLGNAAWQVALLALAAAAAGAALGRAPAAVRHRLYGAALAACWLVPPAAFALAHRSAATASVAGGATVSRIAPALLGELALAPRWSWIALTAAAALALARLARLALAAWATRAIAREADLPLAGRARAVVAQAASAIGVRAPRVVASRAGFGPLTFGLRRPTVVVPAALLAPEAEPLLAAALAHEFAHVARRDFAWNLAAEALLVPLAFHPAAWFLKRRLDETRELACDEAAAALHGRRTYARCLVALAGAAAPGFAMGAIAPTLLHARVRALLSSRAGGRQAGARPTLALAVFALAAAASAHQAFAVAEPSAPASVARSSEATHPAPGAGDWAVRAVAACGAGDLASAEAAWARLAPGERAEVNAQCAFLGVGHCEDAGFFLDRR